MLLAYTEILTSSWLIHSPNHDCNLATYGPNVQVWETENFNSATTWSTQPATKAMQAADNEAHGHESYCSGGDRQEWNVLAAVQDAVANGKTSRNFMMRSNDEANKEGWRKYDNTNVYPEIAIEYWKYPPAPTGITLTPVNPSAQGNWSGTARPTFKISGVQDPNGGNAHAYVQILNKSGALVWQGTTVGGASAAPGHLAEIVPPAGVLNNGLEYIVRAWAAAESNGNYRSKTYVETTFGVDTSPPAPPKVEVQGDCKVGQQCSFTLSGTGADVTDYKYGLNIDVLTSAWVPRTGTTQTVHMQPNIFGPSWVTAKVVDRAGHVSASGVYNFIVKSTSMSHQWSLDKGRVVGSATLTGAEDTGQTGGAPLSVSDVSASGWTEGVNDKNVDGDTLDGSDKAFTGAGDRYASAGTAGDDNELPGLSTADDFSVAGWVQLPAPPASPADGVAISGQRVQNSGFSLGYADGNWVFTVRGTDASAPVTASFPAGNAAGTWVHLAGVYNNESTADVEPGVKLPPRRIVLYVNGRPVATNKVAVPLLEPTKGLFYIGRGTTNGAPSGLWKGAIDDVRTFPGVIDDSQVLRIAAERRPTV